MYDVVVPSTYLSVVLYIFVVYSSKSGPARHLRTLIICQLGGTYYLRLPYLSIGFVGTLLVL